MQRAGRPAQPNQKGSSDDPEAARVPRRPRDLFLLSRTMGGADLLKSVSQVSVIRMRNAPSRERYNTASTPVKDNFLSY